MNPKKFINNTKVTLIFIAFKKTIILIQNATESRASDHRPSFDNFGVKIGQLFTPKLVP